MPLDECVDSMERARVQQGIIVSGLIILVIGMGLHLSVPGVTRSGYPVFVDPNGYAVESIGLELGAAEYSFGIDLLGPIQTPNENFSVYLLDASQYLDWNSGTPIDDLSSPLQFNEDARALYEDTFTSELNLFIVIFNYDDNQVIWTYYYTAMPPTFYPTLMIGFCGLFVMLAALAWLLTGWKRYFVIGISINLVLFFIRIFTLSTYSLGLPDIFEDLIHVELYNDYQFFYLSWIPTLHEGAWPYSFDLFYYLYPPLWIYTTAIFGSVPSWLPGIPLFVFNVATGFFVYKIALMLSGDERHSIFAMLVYLLNPITMLYGSFMWLNPTPYVFFVVGSFYLALDGKSDLSIAALAVATLYKQLAVVFFPLLVIAYIKKRTGYGPLYILKTFLRSTVIYGGIVLLVSLPFLIVSPEQYLNQMIFWNTGVYDRLIVFIPDLWMTVHLGSFYLWLGGSSFFTDLIAFLLINYIFIIICGIVVYGLYATFEPRMSVSDDIGTRYRRIIARGLLWGFIAVLCVQLFYPRGAYKFYLLALAPFFAVLFDYKNLDAQNAPSFSFEWHHLTPFIMASAVFLCFRFAYFWLLAAWGIALLWKGGEFGRIRRLFLLRDSKRETGLSELEEIYSE
jgi:hypothetical protein